MKRSALIAATAIVGALGFAAPAMAAPVLSEDFSGGFGQFTATAGAPIEVTTGTPGYVACCSATGSAANLNDPFVTFGSANIPNSGDLSTTFATSLGKIYTLTFDYAALGGGTGSLNYSVGTLNGTVSAQADNNFDTTFKTFTGSFVGTGSPVTLSFSGVGDGINVDSALDNVSVSAVPEPATWAMMMLGFGMIGFGLRRRSKQSVRVTYA